MKKKVNEIKNINTFAVQINKEKSGYSAIVLGIKDVCATQAKTYEEVMKNIQEVLELYSENLDKSKKVPSSIILMPVYA